MRTELTKLHQRLKTTFIYVTHDQVEAMTMATRIVVMKDGLIQQVDTPQNLYELPCNIFVAGFIGTPQMNFINGTLNRPKNSKDIYFTFNEGVSLKVPEAKNEDGQLEEYIGKEVILGVRPELIHDEERYIEQFPDSLINAKVEVTELMGAEIFLYLGIGEETATTETPAATTETAEATTETAEVEVQDVTLKVWAPEVDQGDENSWLNVMLPKFEEAHPEYNITWDVGVCGEGDAATFVKNDPAAAADVFFYANLQAEHKELIKAQLDRYKTTDSYIAKSLRFFNPCSIA